MVGSRCQRRPSRDLIYAFLFSAAILSASADRIVTGAPGAPGGTGDVGSTGLPGLVGSTGPTGVTGARGPKGDMGVQGEPGVVGSTGSVGATGSIGQQGATGFTGSQGDKGQAGIQGATGATGSTGVAGMVGAQGEPGPQGEKGEQGFYGPDGPSGDKGSVGDKGSQGMKGLQGEPGVKGGPGPPGDADLNECEANICQDGSSCQNKAMGYECSCDQGYSYDKTDQLCKNINECLERDGLCEDRCEDLEGTYECQCVRPGYTVSPRDKHSCIDINECQASQACGEREVCVNTYGSYICVNTQPEIVDNAEPLTAQQTASEDNFISSTMIIILTVWAAVLTVFLIILSIILIMKRQNQLKESKLRFQVQEQ